MSYLYIINKKQLYYFHKFSSSWVNINSRLYDSRPFQTFDLMYHYVKYKWLLPTLLKRRRYKLNYVYLNLMSLDFYKTRQIGGWSRLYSQNRFKFITRSLFVSRRKKSRRKNPFWKRGLKKTNSYLSKKSFLLTRYKRFKFRSSLNCSYDQWASIFKDREVDKKCMTTRWKPSGWRYST